MRGTAAVVLAALVAAAVVLAALVAGAGAAGAGPGAGGGAGEHPLSVRTSAAHTAAVRRIRSAWQKRPRAETTRSSDTVLGPLGLGY
ncbi:hypothetical protein DV20_33100 [Amycolatopsis rifamycinica]|uniref:Uncharacterized protein n=1 Tax=Amycolatopsis rifamycinica TaxID=287986 RepID=A0A066TRZ0_9PSEU|nr:hypothetical protein DV20_33100 [Amycolatopsis rifamycinica]